MPMPPSTAHMPFRKARHAWQKKVISSGLAHEGAGGRALDILIASVALIFLAPLILLVAAVMLLSDRGPIFCAHRRLGRRGKTFPCFKFRTMVPDSDRRLRDLVATDPQARDERARDFKLRRDPRITRVGALLRQSSIDQLPQFVNVLRGEMSIVGPRPIAECDVARYGRYFSHYSAVKPGLTGLWQVSGRNDLSYRRRIALDTCYARKKCLRLDLQILAMTVPALLTSEAAAEDLPSGTYWGRDTI